MSEGLNGSFSYEITDSVHPKTNNIDTDEIYDRIIHYTPSDGDRNSKRQRLSEEDRARRCRERNRVHAKNTRERKKVQLEIIRMRLERLHEEKAKLSRQVLDSTVAGILISLSSQISPSDSISADTSILEKNSSSATATFDQIKSLIAQEISDTEEIDEEIENLKMDKTQYSTEELETIRRERNRIHAKKTRLRKKKMMKEIEETVIRLEEEVRSLRFRAESSTQNKMNALAGVASESNRGALQLQGVDECYSQSSSSCISNNNSSLVLPIDVFNPLPTAALFQTNSGGGGGGGVTSYPISIPYNMIMYSNGFRPSIVHGSQLMPQLYSFPGNINESFAKVWPNLPDHGQVLTNTPLPHILGTTIPTPLVTTTDGHILLDTSSLLGYNSSFTSKNNNINVGVDVEEEISKCTHTKEEEAEETGDHLTSSDTSNKTKNTREVVG